MLLLKNLPCLVDLLNNLYFNNKNNTAYINRDLIKILSNTAVLEEVYKELFNKTPNPEWVTSLSLNITTSFRFSKNYNEKQDLIIIHILYLILSTIYWPLFNNHKGVYQAFKPYTELQFYGDGQHMPIFAANRAHFKAQIKRRLNTTVDILIHFNENHVTPNINMSLLVKELRKKIDCRRTRHIIALFILKGNKNKYIVDFNSLLATNLIHIYPLINVIINIVFYPFDQLICDNIKATYDSGKSISRKLNPKYRELELEIKTLTKNKDNKYDKLKLLDLNKELLTKDYLVNPPEFRRLHYIRYNNEIFIGLAEEPALNNTIKHISDTINNFTKKQWNLEIKPRITYVSSNNGKIRSVQSLNYNLIYNFKWNRTESKRTWGLTEIVDLKTV